MLINYTECNCANDSFLKLLANNRTIDQLLLALVEIYNNYDGETFLPLDCSVRIKDEFYSIFNCGQPEPDIEKIIKKISKMPIRLRLIVQDDIEIDADAFERELYIKVN